MTTPYNAGVRVIAAIVLAVWCCTVGIDPWCCPDGCTDEREHSSQSAGDDERSGDGDCILCLGSIDRPADEAQVSTLIEREFALLQPPDFIDIVLPPAEYPPRS
jgi:hypothetical protein